MHALRSLRAGIAAWTDDALIARVALRAGRADLPLRTGDTLRPLRSDRAKDALVALVTLRTNRTDDTLVALDTLCALEPLRPLRPDRALDSLRTNRPGSPRVRSRTAMVALFEKFAAGPLDETNSTGTSKKPTRLTAGPSIFQT